MTDNPSIMRRYINLLETAPTQPLYETKYMAIAYTLTGDKVDKIDFSCRQQATAEKHSADKLGALAPIVKLLGRTSSWYIDGQWRMGQAANRALDAVGYSGTR